MRDEHPTFGVFELARSSEPLDQYEVVSGKRVRLTEMSTAETGKLSGKKEARAELKRFRKQIYELVEKLAAEKRRAVLVVLQGVDAAGKDGTVRHVFTGINPELCHVTAFEPPAGEELRHDYLWRVHRALPATGVLGVFNRSHYEDVLVTQAHGELSIEDARMRLRQIADAERAWTENGITLLKFFLHISRKEQGKRFQARLDDPKKRWKVQKSDFRDRRLWAKFRRVYEEVFFHTARPYAPWYIIPADHKWYRDVVVAEILLRALRKMNPQYPRRSFSGPIS